MTAMDQSAILLDLAIQLKRNGSWAGETHVQKAAFLLQKLLEVPLGFDFVLYKHGPFSFDLRDLLNQMEAERCIQLKEQPYPYGPKITEGSAAEALRRSSRAAELYCRPIEFVAAQLSSASVSTLERIATALFLTLDTSIPVHLRTLRLVDLKPHVQINDAQAAFHRLDEIREAAISANLIQKGSTVANAPAAASGFSTF